MHMNISVILSTCILNIFCDSEKNVISCPNKNQLLRQIDHHQASQNAADGAQRYWMLNASGRSSVLPTFKNVVFW